MVVSDWQKLKHFLLALVGLEETVSLTQGLQGYNMTQLLNTIWDMYSLQSAMALLRIYLRETLTHIPREGYARLGVLSGLLSVVQN